MNAWDDALALLTAASLLRDAAERSWAQHHVVRGAENATAFQMHVLDMHAMVVEASDHLERVADSLGAERFEVLRAGTPLVIRDGWRAYPPNTRATVAFTARRYWNTCVAFFVGDAAVFHWLPWDEFDSTMLVLDDAPARTS
jgi:hypothetical protein